MPRIAPKRFDAALEAEFLSGLELAMARRLPPLLYVTAAFYALFVGVELVARSEVPPMTGVTAVICLAFLCGGLVLQARLLSSTHVTTTLLILAIAGAAGGNHGAPANTHVGPATEAILLCAAGFASVTQRAAARTSIVGVLIAIALGPPWQADRLLSFHHAIHIVAAGWVGWAAAAMLEGMRRRDFLRLKEMEGKSIHDTLTGLLNRRGLEEALAAELPLIERQKGGVCVMVIDADHFKSINDSLGHAAGDIVLAAIGQAVAASVRTSDIAARWGGEEFTVVLPFTAVSGAALLAQRIRAKVTEAIRLSVRRRITVSVGIAAFNPSAGESFRDALARADQALYRAKANGRDRIEIDTQPAGEAETVREAALASP